MLKKSFLFISAIAAVSTAYNGLASETLLHLFQSGQTWFDGPNPKKIKITPLEMKPAEIPDDLRNAKERWGIRAQIAKLASGPAPDGSFTFAVIGDAEPGRFPWQRIFAPGADGFARLMRMIHAKKPHFAVQLGDFVSIGNVENYRLHISYLDREVRIPLIHIIGNHDRSHPTHAADKKLYRAIFTEQTDFYFDFGDWRFIAIDSADFGLSNEQIRWLQLALDTDRRKIVFTHMPPKFLDGKLESPNAQINRIIAPPYFDQGSREFDDLVSRAGVERVYMGHIHAFATARHRGVTYVLSGGGGSPLYPLPPGYPQWKRTHYILVEASANGLKETIHTIEGQSFPIEALSNGYADKVRSITPELGYALP